MTEPKGVPTQPTARGRRKLSAKRRLIARACGFLGFSADLLEAARELSAEEDKALRLAIKYLRLAVVRLEKAVPKAQR